MDNKTMLEKIAVEVMNAKTPQETEENVKALLRLFIG